MVFSFHRINLHLHLSPRFYRNPPSRLPFCCCFLFASCLFHRLVLFFFSSVLDKEITPFPPLFGQHFYIVFSVFLLPSEACPNGYLYFPPPPPLFALLLPLSFFLWSRDSTTPPQILSFFCPLIPPFPFIGNLFVHPPFRHRITSADSFLKRAILSLPEHSPFLRHHIKIPFYPPFPQVFPPFCFDENFLSGISLRFCRRIF